MASIVTIRPLRQRVPSNLRTHVGHVIGDIERKAHSPSHALKYDLGIAKKMLEQLPKTEKRSFTFTLPRCSESQKARCGRNRNSVTTFPWQTRRTAAGLSRLTHSQAISSMTTAFPMCFVRSTVSSVAIQRRPTATVAISAASGFCDARLPTRSKVHHVRAH